MLAKVLILSVLALTGTDAACQCYSTDGSTVKGSKVSLSNGYDSSDFSTCYPDNGCGFIADSGSATVGWSNVTITFGSSADKTGKFVFYDGKDSTANIVATYSVGDTGTTKTLTSTTQYLYVKYTQDDKTNPDAYFGNMMAGSPFSAPMTTPPTTQAPTTRAYNNPLYPKDPWLISHDILILVNQKTTLGQAGLKTLNDLATKFVDELSITNSITSTGQSRLGLATITPYDPYYSAQGEIWSMSASDVVLALPQSGVSINVDIITALKKAVPAFFNVSDPFAPTRKSVQRSVILFTAWWDDTKSLDDDTKSVFDDKGVNLAIVGYNLTSTTLLTNSWYNHKNLNSNTTQDVADVINRFYMNNAGNNNNGLVNNWCAKGKDPVFGSDGNVVKEPSNYVGPTTLVSPWVATFDGQSKRYCNFQDTIYTYNRNSTDKLVKVTVFYELEIEQDYLKFFADGVEVESFTGQDVNNAVFQLDANQTTARFTTNNSNVQRGFYIQFDEVPRS